MGLGEEQNILLTKTSRWMAFGFLGRRFMLIILAVVVASLIGQFFEPDLIYVFYVFAGVYLLLFLSRLFGMKREKVELSNQSVIVHRRVGSSRRKIIIPLNHIAVSEIERGKLARFFGFGSMKLYTTGNHIVSLESIANVEAFYGALHKELTLHWYRQG